MESLSKHLIFSLMFTVCLIFTACDDHQDRYDDPDWLEGSNIEVLEENEEYSIFLDLLKRNEDYYNSVDILLYTLFVPTDEAFEDYFEANGITGLDDLSQDELEDLLTSHLLINGRSRFDLIYEWAFGEASVDEYGAVFFQKKTLAAEPDYKELPRYLKDEFPDSITIISRDKYVPLWSTDYLEVKFAEESDYRYLYPNSNWAGYENSALDNLAMNWGNARILPNPNIPVEEQTELGIKTSSGYIYPLDQVLDKTQTIELYLKNNQDRYGLFYDLLQRFAKYSQTTQDDQIVYRKSYTNGIENICDDRGPTNTGWNPQYYMIDMFTAFLPNDDILQAYLDENILPTYGVIDSVPDLTLSYLLRAHINNSLGLPSRMSSGYFDNLGNEMGLDTTDFNHEYCAMCSNGPVYDLKEVLEPYAFKTITRELFLDKNYSTFLYMLESNDLLSNLTVDGDEVTLFACTNDDLADANIRYSEADDEIQYKGANNLWKPMSSSDLEEFIQNHIVYKNLTSLSGEGFVEMSSGNYIYYNNGKVQASQNQFLDQECTSDQLISNGYATMYDIDKPLTSDCSIGKYLLNDPDNEDIDVVEISTDTTLTMFSDLLQSLSQLYTYDYYLTGDLVVSFNLLPDGQWTIFAPTNEAMRKAEAEGLIPSRRDSLVNWIYYHCVRNNVIFDDGNPSGTGTFSTNLEIENENSDVITYETLYIDNSQYNLQVTDKFGNVVKVEHSDANNLVQKGVVHKINTVFRPW